MWSLLATVGAASGIATAHALSLLFRSVRPHPPLPLIMVGWLAALATTGIAVLLTRVYLSMRHDPEATLGPFWGMIARMLGVLLLVCGFLGLVHRYRYQMSWAKAFGIVMVEAGAAVAVGLVVNSGIYPIAEILRGGSRDIPAILESFSRSRYLLGCFNGALVIALLLIEITAPFIPRRNTMFRAVDGAANPPPAP